MTEAKMQLVDWLDDLCVRFIINLPQEELESVERICFQVEEAQWFYEDFVRPLDPLLPSMSLRQFSLLIFKHCPLLASFSQYHHLAAFEEFLAYKTRVPVRGAILLNDAMDQVLLVRGWKKAATWSFPRGKINKDERDLDCAVREVYEETGYDLEAAGLVMDDSKMKYIEVTMREQHMKLYVFRGIPEDTVFQPRTRKEIGKIQWYRLANLPGYHKSKNEDHANTQEALNANKLYMVAPFLQPLKKWIGRQRKADASRGSTLATSVQYADSQAYSTNNELQAISHAATDPSFPSVSDPNGAAFDSNGMVTAAVRNTNRPAPAPDAAQELKRLLSVAPPAASAAVSDPGMQVGPDPNSLLHLLRKAPGSSAEGPVQRESMPQTPLEQISYKPPEPKSPRHHQPKPALFQDLGPPPPFPHSPAQSAQRQPVGFRFPSRDRDSSVPSSIHEQPPSYSPPLGIGAPQEQIISNRGHQHAPPPVQQPPVQLQRPGFATGEQQFQREMELPSSSVANAPPASNLPPPKLSAHALNLLNAFKSNEKINTINRQDSREVSRDSTDIQPTQPRTSSALDLPQSRQEQTNTLHKHSESRSRQALGLNSPPVDVYSPQNVATLVPTTNPAPAVKPSANQDALLQLFRNQASSATPIAEAPTEKTSNLLPDPVELSAMPSPGIKPQTYDETSTAQAPIEKLSIRPVSPTRNLSQQSGELTSANISRPPNFPDFGSVRRKQKAAKPAGEDTDASVSQPGAENRPVPIKILKRPTEPGKDPRAMKTPDFNTGLDPAELKGSTPKAFPPNFQPQILQRDEAAPRKVQPSATSAQQEPLTFDRREGVTNEQKQTLLSLFNKPAAAGTQVDERPQIASPVSVQSPRLPDDKASDADRPNSRANSMLSTSRTAKAERPSSRMNSLPSFPPESAAAQEMSGSRRGSQTPLSPSDKGFLLSYLQGVANTVGR